MFAACASTEVKDMNAPENLFKVGEELQKDERYEEAIQKFSEIKNKHPYSRFATLAELKIADIHFAREAFIEAQGSYQLFKELHPRHEKIDYVTLRVGLSYFNQLPSSVDRDLTVANKAISYFEEVSRNYPNTEFAKEAAEKRNSARHMLASKELYIGDYYLKRENYLSALKRYEKILSSFSDQGLNEKGLYGAGLCAFEVGERDKGTKYFSQLISQYGQTNEASKAREVGKKYGYHWSEWERTPRPRPR